MKFTECQKTHTHYNFPFNFLEFFSNTSSLITHVVCKLIFNIFDVTSGTLIQILIHFFDCFYSQQNIRCFIEKWKKVKKY